MPAKSARFSSRMHRFVVVSVSLVPWSCCTRFTRRIRVPGPPPLSTVHAPSLVEFVYPSHLPLQFPDAIATLPPVTQLYVSVDAATKERLKIIDRPLFADYWDRFLACLRALRDKGQRTVYRLTLLKEPNSDAAADGSASHFDSGGAAAAASSAAGGGGGVAPARIVAATPASKRGVTGNMENVRAAGCGCCCCARQPPIDLSIALRRTLAFTSRTCENHTFWCLSKIPLTFTLANHAQSFYIFTCYKSRSTPKYAHTRVYIKYMHCIDMPLAGRGVRPARLHWLPRFH